MSDEEHNNNNNANEDQEMEEGLTKEEEAKCWEAFSAFDKDSSGYIDANELRIVLEMMG
jgi:Ca2+-binding EF-hand superfamily protein